MPIRAGVATAPPPRRTRERLGLSWTAPDGTVWPLTDRTAGYWAISGWIGWGAAPITVTTDALPNGGARVRSVYYEPRLITLPIHITGPDRGTYLARYRGIADAITQTTEYGRPGMLTATQPDGSARQIPAWYQSGWDGQAGMGWLYDQVVLTLLCETPWWEDTQTLSITREFHGAPSSFFSPYPHISSSQTLGDTTITNPGQVACWPTVTVTGPASGITATRNDTGQSWTLAPPSALDEGDVVTIDTSGDGTVIGPDGSNWLEYLDWPAADLWSLPRGDTPVTLTVGGSGAGTSVTLSFRPRYATA